MKSRENFFNLEIGKNVLSIDPDRLAQAVIVHCDDMYSAIKASRQMAEALLSARCHSNPDLFELRPMGKGGLIKVEQVRGLILELQKSPYSSKRKVAIIYEADRLGAASSNALLKTLEEPPMDSSIILVTGKYFSLLATVRSRCGLIRLPKDSDMIVNRCLIQWLDGISDWVRLLIQGRLSLEAGIVHCYLIIDQLEEVLDSLVKEFVKGNNPSTLSASFTFSDGEDVDNVAGDQLKIAQNKVFSAMEIRLSEIFYAIGNNKLLSSFIKVIESLENAARATEMNSSMAGALESVLLLCLKYLAEVGYDECEVSRNSSDMA
ncbi:MAG: hypothetical protein LBH49_00370 [Puniceicoccales bacterium]|jgi:DNA polymerase-3 subunit delta'|nr:hypothetical protein [Puniceicoccales bacterium]